jgi:hypothetical protein
MEIRQSRKERVVDQDERALQQPSSACACNQNLAAGNCQLVQFSGPEDAVKSISVPHHSGTELDKRQAPAELSMVVFHRTSSERTERAERKARITARSISLACNQFFRSRGMPLKQNFNARQRSQQTRKENQT